jgi:fluoride exporter
VEKVLLVGSGGAIGSVTRYLVGGWFAGRFGSAFPYGTYVINVTASFIIGFFLALAQVRAGIGPYWRLFVATGFVGGYSTFSTFEYESMRLLQDGEMLYGMLYLIGSMVTGLGGAVAGIALGGWI